MDEINRHGSNMVLKKKKKKKKKKLGIGSPAVSRISLFPLPVISRANKELGKTDDRKKGGWGTMTHTDKCPRS